MSVQCACSLGFSNTSVMHDRAQAWTKLCGFLDLSSYHWKVISLLRFGRLFFRCSLDRPHGLYLLYTIIAAWWDSSLRTYHFLLGWYRKKGCGQHAVHARTDGKTDFYGSPHVPLSDSSIDGAVVQQRGLQSLIFISLFHLIMASGVGEEEKKVDSIANI